MSVSIAARAPNHLGDGVLALPAIHALARLAGPGAAAGGLTIHGPRWAAELYRDVPAAVRPRGALGPVDVAVLFAPSLRAAIEARWARRRVGTPTDHRGWLLTDAVAAGPHRFDTYRSLVERVGARIDGPPSWARRPTDPAVAEVPAGHVGLNPVSVSGAVREWAGFGELARRLSDRGAPVVVYAGPGEGERAAARAGGARVLAGLSLPAFASALARCALFVSNDSGPAHFARACGTPTLVLYGSTRPEGTGALGAHAIVGPDASCAPCYRQRCAHARTSAYACLDIGVEGVLARVCELVAVP